MPRLLSAHHSCRTPIRLRLPLVAALLSSPLAAQVVYVDTSATGTGDGSSWADACTDLQAALAAPASQIWVAEGTYTPAGPAGPRTASFALRDGLALYGGFAGGETLLSQRDPAAHPAILSGDLQGDDQADWINHWNNAYHVVTAGAVGPSAVLDGFTVRAGYAESAAAGHYSGGGLLVAGGSPTIAGCRFAEHYATLGAAAVVVGPSTIGFTRCDFSGCLAQPGRGGALYLASGASASLADCDFVSNAARNFSAPGDGGALFLELGSALVMDRCRFIGNTCTTTGSIGTTGGAITSLADSLVARDCVFAGNVCTNPIVGGAGGALWTGRDASLIDCSFTGNSAQIGGGLMLFTHQATLVNCVFAGNSAGDGGGITTALGGLALLANSVLWGNTSPGQPTVKAQIHDAGGSSSLRYSCVQGLLDTIPGEDPPDPAKYPGCIVADPLLADVDGADNVLGTADDDVRLLAGSPCVDAGENASVPAGNTIDLDGHPRFFDVPGQPDTGAGAPPLVDLGAFEFGSSSVWATLGGGIAGSHGIPSLSGQGPLLAGSPGALDLSGARESAPAMLFVALGAGAAPFKGGVLLAVSPLLLLPLVTGPVGGVHLGWTAWPAGTSGLDLVFQVAVQDAAAIWGVSLSTGLRADVP